MSTELRLLLAPRAVYAGAEHARPSYILYYVFFVSLLIAAAASASATGHVTISLLVSLGVSWMFVPLLHVLTATALVASAARGRVRGAPAIALLLKGHAPWSLWLLTAGAVVAAGGYDLYHEALLLAPAAIVLTMRIVYAFCREVLAVPRRRALGLTAAHQAVTWLVAAIYLDRAVSLIPRMQGWLQ